jgi:hypothetical protein
MACYSNVASGLKNMAYRFAERPRGKTLPGAREIASYIWNNPERWRSVYRLNREEYGLVELGGQLVGFTGWIDFALAAGAGKRRRSRRQNPANLVSTATKISTA